MERNSSAEAVLERAAQASGTRHIRSMRCRTGGDEFIFGQSATPGGAWPRYSFEDMITCVDYETGAWTEEITGPRIRAEMRGGGEPSIPRGITYAREGCSWSQVGAKSYPAPWHAPNRLHQVWITPQGVIMAAARNGAALRWRERGGASLPELSFVADGRFSATAYLNEDYLVERVDSSVPVAYCGCLPFVTTYSDYRDFGPARFPQRILRSQGGFPVLAAQVKDVQWNVPVHVEVPPAVREAEAGQRKSASAIADGVWHIPGSHNCVAIDMGDHIIVVEAPLTDSIANAVFEAAKRAIPARPIRHVVNTHHHIDHAGGLRAAVTEGAAILTHALNFPLFERYLSAPRVPGSQASAKESFRIDTVQDRLVLRHGSRSIEIYHVRGNPHADDLLMVYLPEERILIEADAYSPPPPGAASLQQPDAFSVNLLDNIERLGLNVERIVPMHGPVVPMESLYTALGRRPSK